MKGRNESGSSSAARQENNVTESIWPLMSNTLGYTETLSGGFLPPIFTKPRESAHP